MSSRGGIRSGSGQNLLSPHSRLVSKEKKKKTTARLRFALVRGVDNYDFYWLKTIVVIQDRTMNFESGFCNFRNIFFTIAGNIYVNKW